LRNRQGGKYRHKPIRKETKKVKLVARAGKRKNRWQARKKVRQVARRKSKKVSARAEKK